ncbi:MAG: hypothetical protein ACRC2V_00360 [Xenococcaceae cyanobacterium]
MFETVHNALGRLESIYVTQDGIKFPLSFNPVDKTFDESHPRTIALREWEKENGSLDLSDRLPEPVPEIIGYRINKLLPSDRNISSDRFPADINYNTDLIFGLTTKTIDYFGLRVAQIFYQSVDPDTKELIPAIPVVFERYKYTWDAHTKLPLGRVKEIYFYQSDGELSEEFKLLPKEFYNVSDRANITYYRRQTILAWLIARATELGLGKQVKDYFAVYKDQTDKYILYGDCQILKTVKDSTEAWLDLDTTTQLGTVRNAIAVCFTRALEATSNAEVDQFLVGQV